MKLLKVDTIDEAREKILTFVKIWPLKTETIPLAETPGRILADDILSPCDIPSFRRSTVDGYALIAADTAAAGDTIPVFLKQAGSVSMGKPAAFSIKTGECAYVPTGGMLPGGADAVVMVEHCEAVNYRENAQHCEQTGNIITVYEAVAVGEGTAEAGEDFQKGKLLLKRGTVISAREIGALCAAGIMNVSVFSFIDISIFSSGDELVAPDTEPEPGQIRDVNTNALTVLAEKNGYHVVSARMLPDDSVKLESAVREAMRLSDVVVISGGSSQGEKDLTAQIIDRVTKPGVFTHGLAVKPGKPTIIGWDDESKTLLVGLPGHPVSAMVIFDVILSWLTEKLFNRKTAFPIPAIVSCNVPSSPGRTVFQPVVLSLNDGVYFAEPVFGKAAMVTTLTRADGYIIIDMNREGLKKNEQVFVHLF